MHIERNIYTALIIIAFICTIFIPTMYTGDGFEYFGMLVSFANHGSFNLTINDEATVIDITAAPFITDGYFTTDDGHCFSYHFWMYSLLCYPVFFILKLLHLKVLSTFIATNIILLLILSWWILFRTNLCSRDRLCLLVISLFNPVLLYVPWTHPEVYIYVFLFLGLLAYRDKQYLISLFFVSFASLQATPLLLIPPLISLYLIIEKLVLPRTYWQLAAVNSFALLPAVFYWYYYGTWSLLASTGAAKIEYMSWDKVVNLLFDPNYGMVIYFPLLFAVILLQVITKDKQAICGFGVFLLLIVSMTSQINWNPGIMYVSRYCIWIIPIAIIVVYGYIIRLNKRFFVVFFAGYLLTTGLITAYCLYEYRWDNWIRFLPPTQWILRHVPSLYNPPFKVFAERATGTWFHPLKPIELQIKDYLPIQLYDRDGLRKELVMNSQGKLEYRNGDAKWQSDVLYCFSKLPQQLPAISLYGINDLRMSFGSGWYEPENDNQGYYWRWMATSSSVGLFAPAPAHGVVLDLLMGAYFRPRLCTVYLNDTKVFEKEILSTTHISFQGNLRQGINSLTFVSREPAESPWENLESLDSRRLTFAIGQDLQ